MTVSYYQRNLPHWQPEECSIFITWRLYGSLPLGFAKHLRKWEKEPGKQFLAADKELDEASIGPRRLSDPEIVVFTDSAIKRGAELGHYALRARGDDPDPRAPPRRPARFPLDKLTIGIKGVLPRGAAMPAFRPRGKTVLAGRIMRSLDSQPRRICANPRTYIENNPVKAHLCKTPQDWPWSRAQQVAQALFPVRVLRS